MNETVSKIMDELDQFSLHFAFAYAEPNDRGEDILVFTCRELPHREFIYVPGKKGMTLGWDTKQCPLAPAILEEFRRYWQEEAHWKVNEILEDIASYQERLAGELSHKERGEWEQALRWAQEALEEEKEKVQPWEDYLQELLAELDANTSPLRTADIPPMLVERWAWNTPETVEPPFGLPTEDEWEYLCSGGVHTLFPWGDTLELEPIYNEELDNDVKNAFGLVIGYCCRAERVSGSRWLLKGDDGGCFLCGGEGDRAAFAYSPYFQYGLPRYPGETDEELEEEMSKRWCRRILRLPPLET
ncbi:hypothetical protein [Flintibacter muris]|uniref:hypothetical protein n=1 Tax=Flintibacter muris TaxID=2941327 RepID=UPI002041C8DC|nr:hypothetical protein [Flintibacter muris]